MSVDCYACLVFEVSRSSTGPPENEGWRYGPLPIPLSGVNGGPRQVTDAKTRASYFAPRVHTALYGLDSENGFTGRWHQEFQSPRDRHDSAIEAFELLKYANRYLLIAHMQLGPNPVDSLATLAAAAGEGREWVVSNAPNRLQFKEGRPYLLSHLYWMGFPIPEPPISEDAERAFSTWATVQRWQWLLASANSDSVLPDTEAPQLMDGLVWLSSDWRALVLRQGVAYVALTPHTEGAASFHRLARVYVRSIHLDALLLGLLQTRALHELADATAVIGRGDVTASEVARLEGELLGIRARLWWQDIAHRARQTSDILRAFQSQHELPMLYAKIVQDLTDASRYLSAQEALKAEISQAADLARREVQEIARREDERRQQEFQQLLTLVSFVLLPMSIIFSGMALWSNPSQRLGIVSVLISIFFILVTYAASARVRRDLRRAKD